MSPWTLVDWLVMYSFVYWPTYILGFVLHLYEMVGMADRGEHIETLNLKGAEVLKASSFVLNTSLKLKCDGEIYTFKGFAQAKKVIACITESCE